MWRLVSWLIEPMVRHQLDLSASESAKFRERERNYKLRIAQFEDRVRELSEDRTLLLKQKDDLERQLRQMRILLP